MTGRIDCAHVELRAPSGEGSICVTLGWGGGSTGGVESSANGGCQKHQNSHVYRLPKGKANYSNYAGCGNTDISIPAISPRDYFYEASAQTKQHTQFDLMAKPSTNDGI